MYGGVKKSEANVQELGVDPSGTLPAKQSSLKAWNALLHLSLSPKAGAGVRHQFAKGLALLGYTYIQPTKGKKMGGEHLYNL